METSWDEVIAVLSGAYGLTARGTTLLAHSELVVELGDAAAGADDRRYRLRIHGTDMATGERGRRTGRIG